MNDRIIELAEQAGFNVKLLLEPYPSGFPNEDFLALKSFAELIIGECIDIISPYTVMMHRPGEEYLHPILEIKTHFGVE